MNNKLNDIQNDICTVIQNGVHNSEIVKTIEITGNYLNAQTISNWAKEKGIDYTNAKYRIKRDCLETFELWGVKFVIDND
jgi:hypothetical protein